MNVIHAIKSDGGGAARAGLRLHHGLNKKGIHSKACVHRKSSDDDSIVTTSGFKRFWADGASFFSSKVDNYLKKDGQTWGSEYACSTPYVSFINSLNPDIVNLHWLGSGFLPPASIAYLAKRYPLVWTLHDMRAFTGGCHYSEGCRNFENSCGHCPQVSKPSQKDASNYSWRIKNRHFEKSNFTVVTPSVWLANEAKKSSLFSGKRVDVIPNGLDLQRFKSHDKSHARKQLGLPEEKNLILFGALNSTGNDRKGFDLLRKALERLSETSASENCYLLILGTDATYDSLNLPLPGLCLKSVKDDSRISKIYAAADVFVAPSREDNLPNTVIESLACGTPVVAFEIGGMVDMIDHKKTGFLAKPFDIDAMASGIAYCLSEDAKQRVSQSARETAEKNYCESMQASRYIDLYNELLPT